MRAIITASHHTACGEIVADQTPANLPDFGDQAFTSQARGEMLAAGVDRLILIAYPLNGATAFFWALHTARGWYDLRGQQLEIIIGAEG
jgi:hypothetical protein